MFTHYPREPGDDLDFICTDVGWTPKNKAKTQKMEF